MGHHIDEQGRFQSDKFPDLAPDKIVVSFKDPRARAALFILMQHYRDTDPELAEDIKTRLGTIVTSRRDQYPAESHGRRGP